MLCIKPALRGYQGRRAPTAPRDGTRLEVVELWKGRPWGGGGREEGASALARAATQEQDPDKPQPPSPAHHMLCSAVLAASHACQALAPRTIPLLGKMDLAQLRARSPEAQGLCWRAVRPQERLGWLGTSGESGESAHRAQAGLQAHTYKASRCGLVWGHMRAHACSPWAHRRGAAG
jgi:hypothetical protein